MLSCCMQLLARRTVACYTISSESKITRADEASFSVIAIAVVKMTVVLSIRTLINIYEGSSESFCDICITTVEILSTAHHNNYLGLFNT